MRKMMNSMKEKATLLSTKVICAVSNNRGETSVGQAIAILMSVVLGALLLAGLYTLFETIVLPELSDRIQDMFDYAG